MIKILYGQFYGLDLNFILDFKIVKDLILCIQVLVHVIKGQREKMEYLWLFVQRNYTKHILGIFLEYAKNMLYTCMAKNGLTIYLDVIIPN